MAIMKFGNSSIELVQDDITKQDTNAIVNAANNQLSPGGGVSGAIHRAAGSELLRECRALGGCNTGDAKITKGYKLSAKWVIHTVGPVWHGGKNNEDQLLADCYRNSLRLAVENNIETVAFPCISTGVYHFPKERAANIAITQTKDFLKDNKTIKSVAFVCFDEENYSIYERILNLDK